MEPALESRRCLKHAQNQGYTIWRLGESEAQCANHESNKVERYSKTNWVGWTGMPQGFQIYFVWNPRKSDMEGPYKLLPAEQARFGNLAGLASMRLYGPSMSYFLGFQTKYIWNPWGIPVHPAQLVLLYLSTLLDSWLAHCDCENKITADTLDTRICSVSK